MELTEKRKELLELIQVISLENIDSWTMATKTWALETIYKAVHILQWRCNHKDWENDLLILHKTLKDNWLL